MQESLLSRAIEPAGRKLTATRVSMSTLAAFLSRQMDRPVADLTGINGFYNFTLEWTPDERQVSNDENGAPSPDANVPSVSSALQEQMGLKIQAQKAPVQIVVIDRAEKPDEN